MFVIVAAARRTGHKPGKTVKNDQLFMEIRVCHCSRVVEALTRKTGFYIDTKNFRCSIVLT